MPKINLRDEMTIEFASKTDHGKVRTNNEDSLFVDGDNGIFIVADGMGGANSGEVASKMAVDIINTNLKSTIQKQNSSEHTQVMFGTNNPEISESANQLISSIRIANQVIYESSQAYPQNQGMGTTVVAVLIKDNTYIVSWVGDSRVYLVRHKGIQQLTVDHSLVQEQVNKGLIKPEEAEKSEFKNILTRALGSAQNVEADIVETPAFYEDFLILCSDGLTKMIPDSKILEIVETFQEPQKICDKLVETALDAGGRDNVTVVVVANKMETIWSKLLKNISV